MSTDPNWNNNKTKVQKQTLLNTQAKEYIIKQKSLIEKT